MGKKNKEVIQDLHAAQARFAEAELALEHCQAAWELIPVWALERGQNWLPSKEAIRILKRAKDSVRDYGKIHWRSGNDNV